MALDYYLQLSSTVPLRTINGVPNSIWTYTLMWKELSNRRPIDPGPRLALIFSSRINIRDPKDLPEISEIQDTQIEKPDTSDVQYVYRDVQGRVGNTLVFCFVAPSALDTFTPVRLAQQSPLSAPWSDLPFKVSQKEAAALQQVISGPALVCPPIVLPAPQPSPVLPHSARTIQKATIGSILAPPQLDNRADSFQGGNALAKFRFARQLLLQPGEVRAVQQHLASDSHAATDSATSLSSRDSMWELLALFEADPQRSSPPPISALSDVPLDTLSAFGQTISELRKRAVNLASSSVPNQEMQSKEDTAMPDGGKAVQTVQQADPRMLAALSHAAAIANKGLSLNLISLGVLPIGYINLERLEMAPAGIVRGELIATIPLAPLEETAVVQKEWSVTSKEFTSIVTDSLENYSETGVTDNTELAQSTTSQNQHSNQFNITGTVSGGIPVINGSVTSSFGAQDTNSQSATDSRKHAVSLTEKASSRVKKEHKVTISTTTVTGASESTTRTLKNADPNNPIRIDYFRMMREWRVRLYRYGLRLTYDFVIPEPAGALRQAYGYLEWLRSQIGPFEFKETSSYIENASYQEIQKLGDKYGVQVSPPPSAKPPVRRSANPPGGNGWHFAKLEFEVPPDYQISNVHLFADLGGLATPGKQPIIVVEEQLDRTDLPDNGGSVSKDLPGFLNGAIGPQTVNFNLIDVGPAFVQITASIEPTKDAIQRWKSDVWNTFYNAAQTQYYAQQQDIAAKIAELEDRLSNVDTLTLRREESEEIMKLAVAALVGDWVGNMWANLRWVASDGNVTNWPPPRNDPLAGGSAFAEPSAKFNYPRLRAAAWDENVIRFINQAIEWENVVTFLYSYFWDVPDSWEFTHKLRHPDATRQAFLRAGSARVVLTLRKGWEEMWTTFVHTGFPYSTGKEGERIPYLSIAQEIAAYDNRNYPGIPPANPAQSAVRLEEAVYTTSTTELNLP